jgi:hypothetical protein
MRKTATLLRRAALAIALTGSLLNVANASPTASDFEACHLLGARSLQSCLDHSSAPLRDDCWAQSRAATKRCYADVSTANARAKEKAAEARAVAAQRAAAAEQAAGKRQ